MIKTFLIRAAGLTAVVSVIGFALAAPPVTQVLSVADIVTILEASGYSGIEEIERERNGWDVEAVAPDGLRKELTLDPRDGRVLKEDVGD